ncbi:MAG: DUF5671 domain-containing protein [Hyphomicrobiales bacterium]|nr:DUF5671 domain-containing protein [Hyphomicrobiales bacterium]
MAAADTELANFVKEALMRGAARQEIASALLGAGWPEAQVRAALAGYAEMEFPVPVPVPRPRHYLSARDAFVYLVLFSTLGLSAYYLGSLIFQLIDVTFPDPALQTRGGFWGKDRIRWAVAVLVVSFPLYLYLAARTASEVAAESSRRASRVRKWLTYMTLFAAALVIIGDLVALIYQFLTGDLTIRVALKILTVAIISGAIFIYYLRSVSGDEAEA